MTAAIPRAPVVARFCWQPKVPVSVAYKYLHEGGRRSGATAREWVHGDLIGPKDGTGGREGGLRGRRRASPSHLLGLLGQWQPSVRFDSGSIPLTGSLQLPRRYIRRGLRGRDRAMKLGRGGRDQAGCPEGRRVASAGMDQCNLVHE